MKTEFLHPPTTKLSTACTSVCTLWGLLLMVMSLPVLCLHSALEPPLCLLKGFAPAVGLSLCTITVSSLHDPSKWHKNAPLSSYLKKENRSQKSAEFISFSSHFALWLCNSTLFSRSPLLPLFLDRRCPPPPPSQCQFSVLMPLASQQHSAQLIPPPTSHILSPGLGDPTLYKFLPKLLLLSLFAGSS